MQRVIGLAEALQQGTPKPTGLSGTEACVVHWAGRIKLLETLKSAAAPREPTGSGGARRGRGGARLPEEKKNSLSFYAL